MNGRIVPLLTVLVALGLHGTAFAGKLPDYARFAEDEKSSRLEIAIKTFTMPSGQKVDLVGVVHIADLSYYQQLNERFASYDSVLFELVGDPKRLTEPPPSETEGGAPSGDSALSVIQQAVGRYLKLTFQLDAIDYTRKNMVHADTTAEEFRKMQAERGETMSKLFARAMDAQLSGRIDRTAMREFDTIGLLRILLSPDSAAAFKKSLAKVFDQMESMTAVMEGKDGSVVLSGRNDVLLKKMIEVLSARKQRRIAVFYGAAHMPGIESTLTQDLNAKPAGEEWLAAWTMPKLQPAAVSAAP